MKSINKYINEAIIIKDLTDNDILPKNLGVNMPLLPEELLDNITDKQYAECVIYISESFYNTFSQREINVTLRKIDRLRCPLYQANEEMYDFINEKFDEWCDDNDLDGSDYSFDAEDFFWDMPEKDDQQKIKDFYNLQ